MSEIQAFHELSPDAILTALEQRGIWVESGLMALNSYENRVYRFKAEERGWMVAKFYRPERWSDQQIEEEHRFCLELEQQELPVLAPLWVEGKTLHHCGPYRFSLFPSVGGRAFMPESDAEFERLGRLLGRMHAVSQRSSFKHRLNFDLARLGWASLHSLKGYLAGQAAAEHYLQQAEQLIRLCEQKLAAVPVSQIRLHGDCHAGNLLVRDELLTLLDFDDAGTGPAIQDLWMLLTGDPDTRRDQLYSLLAGYEDFCEFDWPQLELVEVFRSLRMLHYSAWLAARWSDPAFPASFPWFARADYWAEQAMLLAEQQQILTSGY